MKEILILSFFILAIGINGQNPIPIPGTQLSNFYGFWYTVWQYNGEFNNAIPNNVNCLLYNITRYSDKKSILNISMTETNNVLLNYYILAEHVTTTNTTWRFENQVDLDFIWIGLSPDLSWGVIASNSTQSAYILSKTPSLSNLIVNSAIVLLKAEGYSVNATNQYSFPSLECLPLS